MVDKFECLEALNAKFIRVSGGRQVWELSNMNKAEKALEQLGADAAAYNWCPVQQPKGPTLGNKGGTNTKGAPRPMIVVG